jgi:general secretion pathway protein K
MRGEKGFALVLTLVVTALMVAVTTELIHQVYVDTTLSRGFRDGQQASLLAESGISGGIKLLQMSLPQDYSSLSDKWATPFKMDDETGSIEIITSEESGKINLNDLVLPNGEYEPFTRDVLRRLGQRLQVPEDVWNNLAAWLNTSKQPSRYGGAQDSYYRSLKPPYSIRNGALANLAELSLVKGVTPEIINKLRPFVTVFSAQGGMLTGIVSKINVNTAPKEVLVALNDRIDDRLADRVLDKRKLSPFKSVSNLSLVAGFDASIATGLEGHATVKGAVYRISSVSIVKDTARTAESVVRLTGGTPEIISWQEY